MKIIEILRREESDQGTISVISIDKQILGFTLEPEDRLNKVSLSSIPTGCYRVRPYSSAKYPEAYQIVDVPGRTKILFHAGNTEEDTAGCILVGSSVGKLKGNRAVLNSGATYEKFKQILGRKEEAHLTIVEHY